MRSGNAYTFRGGPLGNFAPCDLELPAPFDGAPRIYPSVEHYFQACKAADPRGHELIATQPTPRAAKRAGRAATLRSDWEATKNEVMLTALRAKFDNPQFRSALLATGDRLIAEDSPWDFEWGARDANGGWDGENKLGRLLMKVRSEIRAQHPHEAPVEAQVPLFTQ